MPGAPGLRVLAAVAAATLVVAGCGGAAAPAGAPVAEGPRFAERLIEETAPRRPLRILFDWSFSERDARFTGQGVARVQPPYRGRLDLFGPRGETYLSAALVDDEIRLPRGAAGVPLPPPPLLWSALGSFRPPAGAELVSVGESGGATVLEYRRDGERWTFTSSDGRLSRAELDVAGQGRHTIELKHGGDSGVPSRAVYRDWANFRELTLTLDRVEDAEPFPPEIFAPGAARGGAAGARPDGL